MNLAQTSLSPTIALWTPPHQRLLAAAANLARRWRDARRNAAEQRAAQRDARRQHALLSHLDANTLRDVGLGDWAASARDSDAAAYRRTLDLRGF